MKSTTVEIVNVSPGGRNVKYPLLNLSVQYSFQFGIKIKKKEKKRSLNILSYFSVDHFISQ